MIACGGVSLDPLDAMGRAQNSSVVADAVKEPVGEQDSRKQSRHWRGLALEGKSARGADNRAGADAAPTRRQCKTASHCNIGTITIGNVCQDASWSTCDPVGTVCGNLDNL